MTGIQPFSDDDPDFALREDRLEDFGERRAFGKLIGGNEDLFHGGAPFRRDDAACATIRVLSVQTVEGLISFRVCFQPGPDLGARLIRDAFVEDRELFPVFLLVIDKHHMR